jgi:hypothetical protein
MLFLRGHAQSFRRADASAKKELGENEQSSGRGSAAECE